MALPPGPRLPALVQSLQFLAAQSAVSERYRRRYGDVFTLKGLGFGYLVVVSDAALVKQIFTASPQELHAGEGNRILKPLLGEHSVLVLDEDEHLRQRKLMLPSFHGDRMRIYGDLIEDIAAAEIERWPRGTTFELLASMQAITLKVILRAIFGIEDGAQLVELEEALRDMLAVHQLYFVVPQLQRDIGPWRAHSQFLERRGRVDRILFGEIARRREDPALTERQDVLSRLLQGSDENGSAMSDQEVRDELLTLLVAGHETTATALAWFFERLLRHRDAYERCKAGDDEYLRAAIRESLRVRPILHFAMRRTTVPYQLNGYTIPAGATVGASAYLMHHRPDVWDSPEEFRPERFLDGGSATYTWLPFGGGVRRCLGAAFALFEIEVIARTVLNRVELEVPDSPDEKPKRRGITFVPGKGTGVRIAAERADG